ncbi:YciI family protein [Massilia endophytica]|uniref:YciI family protein n=1 Tax=Massilia endophytica TaxID=2899220 RepID=UPI001E31DDBF|nr:YciI family protein [Massilia endophytica]UGQ44719.1 YciI family protein [Massilia endophytica]
MHFMILRRADRSSEQAAFPLPELSKAVPSGRWLHPSARGARLRKRDGQWSVHDVPFADARELVAGFTIIDVPSKQDAIEWAKTWPTADGEGEVELEVRETGCSSGCVGFDTQAAAQLTPYIVLLKSDRNTEADLPTPPEVIAQMNAANQAGVKAGIVLAGEGLQPTSKGARVKFGGGRSTVIDGPFTEIKELIAGFWLIQTATREEAFDWVRNYPFPLGPNMEVELREVVRA